nr:elongator complex protein 6 isoform X4 [Manis javanica]
MAVFLCTTSFPSTSKGVSLTTARERGQLVFLEGLKSSVDVFFQPREEPHPLQFLREADAGSLQPLFEFVQEALKPVASGGAAWRCPVLLVDDLSVLLSLGVGAVAVLDFVHYCRAVVCHALKGNVVALVHDSGGAEDEEDALLLHGVGHQSHLILRAEGLATGFCKDVHGQSRSEEIMEMEAEEQGSAPPRWWCLFIRWAQGALLGSCSLATMSVPEHSSPCRCRQDKGRAFLCPGRIYRCSRVDFHNQLNLREHITCRRQTQGEHIKVHGFSLSFMFFVMSRHGCENEGGA